MSRRTSLPATDLAPPHRLRGLTLLLGGLLALAVSGAAQAYDEPISFDTAGIVTIKLTGNAGGFDHLLDLATSPGTVTQPIFAIGEDPGLVGGFVQTPIDTSVSLGSFAANAVISLRLTNLLTTRIGGVLPSGVGQVASQVFSGVGNTFPNPSIGPSDPYFGWTSVSRVTPYLIKVGFEDAFPGREEFANLNLELTLAPVPEPTTTVLLLAGGGLLALRARRRRDDAASGPR